MKLPNVTALEMRLAGGRYHGAVRAEGDFGERRFVAWNQCPDYLKHKRRMVWQIKGEEWTLTFSERMKIAKTLWKVHRKNPRCGRRRR